MPQYLDFLDLTNKAVRTIGGGTTTVSGTVTVGNAPNVGQTAGPWAVSGTISLTPTVLVADALANPTLAQVNSFPQLYNGINWDRVRSANAASGTTGTGLAGAGNLIYDPLVTGWFNWRGSAVGGAFVQGPAASGALFVGNPHVMAGLFTSGAVGQLVMPLVTDSAGRLIIGGALPNGAAASAPGVSGNPVLLGMTDGTSVWSARSCSNGNAIPAPGCLAVAPTFCDGSFVNQPWNSARTGGDAAAGANFGGSSTYLWNGTNFDRLRSANAASGGVGVGLMAAGGMVYDGTNWWPLKQVVGTSASLVPQGVPAGVNHLWNGTNLLTPMASTQAISDTNAGNNLLGASQYMNNGTAGNGGSFDRVRNNVLGNYFTGANTTSGATVHATATNFNNTGIMVFLNITAISGTAPSLDVKVQVADGAGTFYDLTDSAGNVVAFAQKTATGTDTLKVYPGVIEKLTAASRQYACPIPRSYRLVSTVGGNAMSITYRLDVSEIA